LIRNTAGITNTIPSVVPGHTLHPRLRTNRINLADNFETECETWTCSLQLNAVNGKGNTNAPNLDSVVQKVDHSGRSKYPRPPKPRNNPNKGVRLGLAVQFQYLRVWFACSFLGVFERLSSSIGFVAICWALEFWVRYKHCRWITKNSISNSSQKF